MSLVLRFAAFLLPLFGIARAQFYTFCTNGIAETNFDDHDPIDVIVAQAPLFSTNPKIGQMFGLLGAYHSSILFAQGSGVAQRYWTLEFDNTAPSFIDGVVPGIVSNSTSGAPLVWHNDARYCLSDGLKWGFKHWSKQFEVVASVTADQARHTFTDLVSLVNSTTSGNGPQYQLFHVATTDFFGRMKKTLVHDITCAEGVVWFLHHLKFVQKVSIEAGFVFKASSVVFKTSKIEKVNTDDKAQVQAMVQYFRLLEETVSAKGILGKLADVVKFMFAHKYVYDNNAGVYYRLFGWGSWMPWPHYMEYQLVAPPSMKIYDAAIPAVVV